MSTVLITGSGRRLGRGLAIEFAKSGWNVIVHYNKSSDKAMETMELLKSYDVNSISFQSDVRDINKFREKFHRITCEFGYPDVLINNAAIYPKQHSLQETDSELWNEVIDTNLKSYFEISKIFSKNALSNSKIINIASMGAFRIWKGRIPYNISKAGVLQLTKALAYELAPTIAVNSVSPGSIEIPDEQPDEELALSGARIPMQRFGSVKDVFDAVYFFATCSNYITGQNISVDGGYNL